MHVGKRCEARVLYTMEVLGDLSMKWQYVLRGDVVTGVAKLPPEMVQRVAETFPSTEVLADLVEIVSHMVTVVVYVGHYAGNLQVPIRDLLL